MKKQWLIIGFMALAGLLVLQTMWFRRAYMERKTPFPERVRLALQETADALIQRLGEPAGGNTVVRQIEESSWELRLQKRYEYNCLAPLLSDALQKRHVNGSYEVEVLDCYTKDLILGYAASTDAEPTESTCAGSDTPFGCFNLRLTFTQHYDKAVDEFWTAFALLTLIEFILLVLIASRLRARRRAPEHVPETLVEQAPETPDPGLHFGNSTLFADQLRLVVNGQETSLTEMEARLLHFFAQNRNALLSREEILKAVWPDESATAGRSLDVFVSRLRKLLRADERLRISSVHGQGYRFETL